MSQNNDKKDSKTTKIPTLISSDNLKYLNDNKLSIAKTVNELLDLARLNKINLDQSKLKS